MCLKQSCLTRRHYCFGLNTNSVSGLINSVHCWSINLGSNIAPGVAGSIGLLHPVIKQMWTNRSLFNETHSEFIRIMITYKILMPLKLSARKTNVTIYTFSIGVIIYIIDLKIILITYKYLAYDIYALFWSNDYKAIWENILWNTVILKDNFQEK